MSATGNKTTVTMSHQVLESMSQISPRAALSRRIEDTFPSGRGTPLMQEPSTPSPEPEEPELEEPEEPELEEPAWVDPIFETVTIASVVWSGSKHWDRGLYKLSNGRTAFAGKGLTVGDSPFDYEELRLQGGGYYSAPSGVVGHTFTRNGGAFIIQEGQSFLTQQYAWGSQGPVAQASTSDITSQIFTVEEREDEDMNGDGFIGSPQEDDAEVEISKVIYDNPDAGFDRSIYQLTDGTIQLAEQGNGVGDITLEGEVLANKDGSPIDASGIVGVLSTRSGFSLIYNLDGSVKKLPFKWGNRGPQIAGKLRALPANQVDLIEEREGIDANGDGRIAGQSDEEVEVERVVYDGMNSDFDRSIYEMSDGTVYFAEQGLEKGDLVMEGDPIAKKDGAPIETIGLSGIIGMRNGFAVIYYKEGIATQQAFKWGNRGPREFGRLRDVTKQLGVLEERMNVDLDGNQQIGDQMDEDAEVSKVIFNSGRDGFDRSLYEMDNGVFTLAEPGLIAGDLPFDSDPLMDSDGTPFNAAAAAGVMGMGRGFAMILKEADKYSMQMFSWGGRSPQAKGKSRDITRRIYDTEDRADADFTGDGIIGTPHSGKGDPEISRVIFPGNDEFDLGLYQMQDGNLLFAEPDLEAGDSPFEDEVIFGKNGKPYQNPNVVGVYPIRSGFALVEYNEGRYLEQGFKFGRRGPQPFGKPRKVKDIDKTELRVVFDINNDRSIGGRKNGGDDFDDPEFRLIDPADDNPFVDPLA